MGRLHFALHTVNAADYNGVCGGVANCLCAQQLAADAECATFGILLKNTGDPIGFAPTKRAIVGATQWGCTSMTSG